MIEKVENKETTKKVATKMEFLIFGTCIRNFHFQTFFLLLSDDDVTAI